MSAAMLKQANSESWMNLQRCGMLTHLCLWWCQPGPTQPHAAQKSQSLKQQAAAKNSSSSSNICSKVGWICLWSQLLLNAWPLEWHRRLMCNSRKHVVHAALPVSSHITSSAAVFLLT
jgi:hypothetical protein